MPRFRRLVMIITIRHNVRITHPFSNEILKLHYRQGFESLPTFRGLCSNNIHKINRITYKITLYYWWLLIKTNRNVNVANPTHMLIPSSCDTRDHVLLLTHAGHAGHVECVSIEAVTGVSLLHTHTSSILTSVQYTALLCSQPFKCIIWIWETGSENVNLSK